MINGEIESAHQPPGSASAGEPVVPVRRHGTAGKGPQPAL